jgi:ribosomal protein S3
LQKAQITKTVVIPSEHHGFVVGAGGKHVQQLTSQFNVSIKFPKRASKTASEGATASETTATEASTCM